MKKYNPVESLQKVLKISLLLFFITCNAVQAQLIQDSAACSLC